MTKPAKDNKSQVERFRDAAREAETDDREATLDRIIQQVGKAVHVEVEQGPEAAKILDNMDKAGKRKR